MVERLATEPRSFESDVDQRLFQAARRELWKYEPLRATQPQLELEARHGTLRVAGRVRTQAIKEIVGYICLRLAGAAVIRNELVSDTEVVRQVADAMAADPVVGPLCLRVDVRDGIATLSGELPSAELEQLVVAAAQQAPDAADIVSNLVVRRASRPPTAPEPKPAADEAAAVGKPGA